MPPKAWRGISSFLDIRIFDSPFSESLNRNSFTEKALPRKGVDAGCDDLYTLP
jgi:hypothetical protein